MQKKFISVKVFCTFALLWWGAAFAQSTGNYESISTAQGLSQGMVFDMLQDKDGFIWVATKNGLNRYDGYSFKVFTNDPYNLHSLSSNTILKLFEDSKGRIWAGTENAGVNIYDKRTGNFYRISQNTDNRTGLSDNGIRSIAEMPDGKILIATDNGGLNIVQVTDELFKKETAPVITQFSLPNNTRVYGMGKDKNNLMWVGGMDGVVYQLDPANNFIPLPGGKLYNNGYLNSDGSIVTNYNYFLFNGKEITPLFDTSRIPEGNIILNPNEMLWENHHREFHYYDISRWGKDRKLNWHEALPIDTATRICYPFIIDRSGILWNGTVGYGLRKYNTTSSKFKTLAKGNSVRLIIPAADTDIYLVNYSYKWMRLKNNEFSNDAYQKILSATQADNFIIASTKEFWLKSDKTGYYKYNPASNKLQSYSHINANEPFGRKQPFMEDSKGNLWFPGQDGAITLLNIATEKPDSFTINKDAAKILCTALYEDKEAVWIGTENGFVKATFTDGRISSPKIEWFYNNSSNRNSLNYNNVSCFLNDPAAPGKYLWIATKGGGLNRLNKITGDFFHLTTKDGLPDDVVYSLLTDDGGNIWGSTNKGIFCLLANKNDDSTNWVFRNFSKANGLQDDEFNTGAYAKLSNGNLAFGGVNGLNIFDPKDILVPGFMPNVFITDIFINNQPVSAGDKTGVLKYAIEQSKEITLTHLQDILTLEFSSLDYTAPGQNKYRYQLIGVDKDWVESNTRRTATYLHLPAGKYIFKVQGSNSQGIWSDQVAELQITILPPWWLSWWAYLLYVLLLGIVIRAYFKFSINRAKLKAQLNYEQLEAKRVKELDTVKTQLYTNITHEFRTPLTVILGMAQQVKNDPPAYLENGMDMIMRNGQSLLNLVNEMLDLSKLETGKMSLQLVNGDVIAFLRYIVESFHSLAESQHKQLHFLSGLDSLYIEYDPEKLRQIVANLLSNALKFTEEKGNIYISLSELSSIDIPGNASLIIKVKDTGIGIAENQLLNIFDRFYQLDNSHTRKTEGTGIGLALTKELVRLMGGDILVKSPPTGANKGSEFTVTFPVKRTGKINTADSYIEPAGTDQQIISSSADNYDSINEGRGNEKPLVLLVEDNADVVAYTASCLPDYRLAVGKDGREGLEIAIEIIPDLIITDVMMPFVDGFEMSSLLRHNEMTSHIPIIILTAKADIESRMEGIQRGADAYLEKPFNKEELLIRVKKLLELRKKLQQYYFKKAGLSEKESIALPADELNTITDDIKTEDEFVRKIREAVEAHLTDADLTVEKLCKKVFMSHSQLHRKLDALTGCSPNKFIRIIRLNKAKELLKDAGNSIGSIALECGYNDPGYFARVFKQEFAITPQEWRNNNTVA